MIARYNLRQTLLACFSACVGLGAFALAWWFFNLTAGYALRSAGVKAMDSAQSLITWGCVAAVAVVGFLRWGSGGSYHRFDESGMMITAEPRSGVSMHVHTVANRVAAWSYLLGQLFLAGPLQILRAYGRLRMRIPNSPRMESELIALRDQLRAKNRWRSISEFAGNEQQVVYLARLGLIDWSPSKGTLRAR